MKLADCIYPDCQVRLVAHISACEHSCPYEKQQKEKNLLGVRVLKNGAVGADAASPMNLSPLRSRNDLRWSR